MSTQSFQHNETLVQSERQFPPQKIEPTQNETSSLHIRSGFLNGNSERSQEHHEDDADQRINGDIGNNSNSASSEDGYNWRKCGPVKLSYTTWLDIGNSSNTFIPCLCVIYIFSLL